MLAIYCDRLNKNFSKYRFRGKYGPISETDMDKSCYITGIAKSMKKMKTNLWNRNRQTYKIDMKKILISLWKTDMDEFTKHIYAQIYETGIDRYMKQILTNLWNRYEQILLRNRLDSF